MNLYTNNPSRFGGCFSTFDPTASQATVVVVVQQGGGTSKKKKRRAIRFSDFETREQLAEAMKVIPAVASIEEPDDDDILIAALTRIFH